MPFQILDTISLPGDPYKPNDDSFGHADTAAVVLDGATSLGDPLMPGDSDAAWIAHFGARRLMAHCRDGDAPKDALRHTLADAEKSFIALRRRAPEAMWEMPFASMAFAAEATGGFDFLWYGDCAGLLLRPGEKVEVLGESFAKKAQESAHVARLAKEKNLSPASGANRPEYLPSLRKARDRLNSGSHWAFSPDERAAGHVASRHVAAPAGSSLLLASDGFLALTTDYGAHTVDSLMAKALDKGLAALAEELRAAEEADAEGHKFPRFKKSDDATAVLLRLG
ncbi:MAG: hypothetical protein WDN01_19700 [Rhizomicrobium sp.]